MAFCPKCGYERLPKDDEFVPKNECPKCGIVYEKYAELQRELNEKRNVIHFQPLNSKKNASIPSITWNAAIWIFIILIFMAGWSARNRTDRKNAMERNHTLNHSLSVATTTRSIPPKQNQNYSHPERLDHSTQEHQFKAKNRSDFDEFFDKCKAIKELHEKDLDNNYIYYNKLESYHIESIKRQPIYSKIRSILYNYHTHHTYMADEFFVCLDMAIDVWNLLETAGIRAALMVGNIQTDITSGSTLKNYIAHINHVWVLAEASPSVWIPLEATGGYIVEPSTPNFRLYNIGTKFNNPKECKDFNASRSAMFDTCNETAPMADNFNRLFAGKPMTAESTEYTGRMKQKFDDCERLTGKVISFLGVR